MSGEALKQEIRKTSEERTLRVLAEARIKADAIIADAEREAKIVSERRIQDAERLLEQDERSEAAKAKMECTKNVLSLQSLYFEEAFQGAAARVNNLPTEDPILYRTVLTNFIKEAIQQLGSSTNFTAVGRDSDRSLVEDILNKLHGELKIGMNCSISTESLASAGGILLHTMNMRIYYVNTFESRLAKAKEDLRAEVVNVLLKPE